MAAAETCGHDTDDSDDLDFFQNIKIHERFGKNYYDDDDDDDYDDDDKRVFSENDRDTTRSRSKTDSGRHDDFSKQQTHHSTLNSDACAETISMIESVRSSCQKSNRKLDADMLNMKSDETGVGDFGDRHNRLLRKSLLSTRPPFGYPLVEMDILQSALSLLDDKNCQTFREHGLFDDLMVEEEDIDKSLQKTPREEDEIDFTEQKRKPTSCAEITEEIDEHLQIEYSDEINFTDVIVVEKEEKKMKREPIVSDCLIVSQEKNKNTFEKELNCCKHSGGNTKSLNPEKIKSLDPIKTKSHDLNETESFDPKKIQSLDPIKTKSHDLNETESFDPKKIKSLDPIKTKSHDLNETESFDPNKIKSLDPIKTKSHDLNETESFDPKKTKSLDPIKTKSLNRKIPEAENTIDDWLRYINGEKKEKDKKGSLAVSAPHDMNAKSKKHKSKKFDNSSESKVTVATCPDVVNEIDIDLNDRVKGQTNDRVKGQTEEPKKISTTFTECQVDVDDASRRQELPVARDVNDILTNEDFPVEEFTAVTHRKKSRHRRETNSANGSSDRGGIVDSEPSKSSTKPKVVGRRESPSASTEISSHGNCNRKITTELEESGKKGNTVKSTGILSSTVDSSYKTVKTVLSSESVSSCDSFNLSGIDESSCEAVTVCEVPIGIIRGSDCGCKSPPIQTQQRPLMRPWPVVRPPIQPPHLSSGISSAPVKVSVNRLSFVSREMTTTEKLELNEDDDFGKTSAEAKSETDENEEIDLIKDVTNAKKERDYVKDSSSSASASTEETIKPDEDLEISAACIDLSNETATPLEMTSSGSLDDVTKSQDVLKEVKSSVVAPDDDDRSTVFFDTRRDRISKNVNSDISFGFVSEENDDDDEEKTDSKNSDSKEDEVDASEHDSDVLVGSVSEKNNETDSTSNVAAQKISEISAENADHRTPLALETLRTERRSLDDVAFSSRASSSSVPDCSPPVPATVRSSEIDDDVRHVTNIVESFQSTTDTSRAVCDAHRRQNVSSRKLDSSPSRRFHLRAAQKFLMKSFRNVLSIQQQCPDDVVWFTSDI